MRLLILLALAAQLMGVASPATQPEVNQENPASFTLCDLELTN